MMDLILKCRYADMTGAPWEGISQAAKAFVESMLQYDPKARPTAKDALRSGWFGPSLDGSWAFQPTPLSDGGSTVTISGDGQQHLTDFRRRAWQLLASTLTSDEIGSLQRQLEQQDVNGLGSVDLQDFVRIVEEVAPSLSDDDISRLVEDQISAVRNGHIRMEYIDFVIGVKRGRSRNIIDNLSAVLDNMDQDGSRMLPIKSLVQLVDQDAIPAEFKEEARRTLATLHEFYGESGKVSTIHLLQWIQKRESDTLRNSSESYAPARASSNHGSVLLTDTNEAA
jgi:Ca2+-binding EF-hand superfamily protein